MRKRLLKYLRRLAILVVILGILGLAAFSWFCYWPFEGGMGDVMALVPAESEFVLRFDYDDLRATGWPEKNVEQDPLHPLVADWVDGGGVFRSDPALRGASRSGLETQLEDVAERINENIPLPFAWATFGVEKDVLRGETVVAGRWCQGQGPRQGPPRWQEILVLTRVSWRTKCMAALKHDFVRDMIVNGSPDIRTIEKVADGLYKLTTNAPVSPAALRSGCGRGFVMPPENEWYLMRAKDVVAISNSESLVRQSHDLSKGGGGRESFAGRSDVRTEPDPNGFVAVADLEPMSAYFVRLMEDLGQLRVLNRWLKPRSLQMLNGGLSLGATDVITLGGTVDIQENEAGPTVANVYKLAQRPVTEGIPELVPAKDTFATLFLRSDPLYLLESLYEEGMNAQQRRLWNDNLLDMQRQGKTQYKKVTDFFRDLAERMGDTATVALARLSEDWDQQAYRSWELETHEYPPTEPVIALVVRLREGANPEEVDTFLSQKVPLLGFKEDLERVAYRGYTYTKLELIARDALLHWVRPGYILLQDYLVFASNEAYLRQILDTVAAGGEGSLARDETYRTTMSRLPQRGHVALFVDLEKATRVPQSGELDGQPRGFLWDMRWTEVTGKHDPREEVLKERKRLTAKYPQPLSREHDEEITEAMDDFVLEWESQYPEWVEKYRTSLEGFRRFRGLGFVMGANGDRLDMRVGLTLREAEDWVAWLRK